MVHSALIETEQNVEVHLTEFLLQQLDWFEVWERPLSNNFMAIAIRNMLEIGGPRKLPIMKVPGWRMCDFLCNVTQILPQFKELGVHRQETNLAVTVNPSGVALLTIHPILD